MNPLDFENAAKTDAEVAAAAHALFLENERLVNEIKRLGLSDDAAALVVGTEPDAARNLFLALLAGECPREMKAEEWTRFLYEVLIKIKERLARPKRYDAGSADDAYSPALWTKLMVDLGRMASLLEGTPAAVFSFAQRIVGLARVYRFVMVHAVGTEVDRFFAAGAADEASVTALFDRVSTSFEGWETKSHDVIKKKRAADAAVLAAAEAERSAAEALAAGVPPPLAATGKGKGGGKKRRAAEPGVDRGPSSRIHRGHLAGAAAILRDQDRWRTGL